MKASTRTIGVLARESGVSVETVRFYERRGLLRQPARQGSGFRTYESDDAKRIRFVKRAQELGFTLKEVQEMLDINVDGRASCGAVKGKSDLKLKEIEAKILDLKRMKRSLERLSDACGEGKKAASQCRILDCFEAGFKC